MNENGQSDCQQTRTLSKISVLKLNQFEKRNWTKQNGKWKWIEFASLTRLTKRWTKMNEIEMTAMRVPQSWGRMKHAKPRENWDHVWIAIQAQDNVLCNDWVPRKRNSFEWCGTEHQDKTEAQCKIEDQDKTEAQCKIEHQDKTEARLKQDWRTNKQTKPTSLLLGLTTQIWGWARSKGPPTINSWPTNNRHAAQS